MAPFATLDKPCAPHAISIMFLAKLGTSLYAIRVSTRGAQAP
jgi:hypothetical protein